jgi:DNA-directed RNA polymerase subunit K/omega
MPVESPSLAALDPSIGHDADAVGAKHLRSVRRALDDAARDVFAVPGRVDSEDLDGRVTHHIETPSIPRSLVIRRPPGMGAFQFVVLAKLRAGQLMRGCRPRVDSSHKPTVIAQLEVSAGKVTQLMPDKPNGTSAIGVAVVEEVPVMVGRI